ncbi:transmembrane protein, putative, partial [Bodo saltans]
SLRASTSTHTTGRDSWADVQFVLAPLLFQVIFQALMGIDFRGSKAGCGIAFLSAGSCSLALSLFFMLSKRNRSHLFCIVQVTSFGVQTLLLFAFAAAIFTDQDETARSFVIATAYAVSVASVVRMCATIATFVWESKQPTGALENSTAKKPSSDLTMFSKRKEPTLWRVGSQYHSLQLLVNEICFSRVSQKK